MNTTTSDSLYAEACDVLAGGVSSLMRKNVLPILYYDRAEGPYYYTADGDRMLDYTLAWGPTIVGNNHPTVNAAVTAQLQKHYDLGAQHRGEIELAKLMVGALPGVDQVVFSNTGSEAVQCALRLARATTGRRKMVKFEGHYHGWFNNVLVSYKPKAEQLGAPVPTVGGQPDAEYADTLVLPWNDVEALKAVFRAHPREIACVITEPILANSGCCMPAAGFLEAVIDLCRQYGALSIFDEVITGYRVALGGARAYFGLEPDISTYAKAMAGGFTMAAVGARREVFDCLRDGRTTHAGTYNGNSVNVAAAIAVQQILAEPGAFTRMHAHGDTIRGHIEAGAKKRGIAVATSGVGTVFSVHFGQSRPPRDYAETLGTDMVRYGAFRAALLEAGVQVLPDARWYVGWAHDATALEQALGAVDAALDAIA